MATRNGLDDFENVRLEPISLTDCAGDPHEFHFQIRLLGTFLSLKAFELRDQQPCGHQFEILGDPECDAFSLLGKLIERMRRALASKQLNAEPYTRDHPRPCEQKSDQPEGWQAEKASRDFRKWHVDFGNLNLYRKRRVCITCLSPKNRFLKAFDWRREPRFCAHHNDCALQASAPTCYVRCRTDGDHPLQLL